MARTSSWGLLEGDFGEGIGTYFANLGNRHPMRSDSLGCNKLGNCLENYLLELHLELASTYLFFSTFTSWF